MQAHAHRPTFGYPTEYGHVRICINVCIIVCVTVCVIVCVTVCITVCVIANNKTTRDHY